jgi:DNA (cytosine-5)-methyltransferase 1
MEWLGIYYEENIYYKGNHCPAQILRNCVHPNLGLQIFNQRDSDTRHSLQEIK